MKAFTNASSLQSKLRTLGTHVDDDATVDALGVIISLIREYCKHELYLFGATNVYIVLLGSDYSYRRGLRSCLSIRGGKFEGQDCEISNEYESHAFSLGISMTFALILRTIL